jgi:hypothetical protein
MLFGSLLVVRSGERQEPAGEGESPRKWQTQPLMLDARLQMPSETVRAIQPTELSAAFLHSEGTFVVVTGEQTFVWVGKASRLFPSHDAVKTMLLRVGRGATVPLMEGDEEADFWKALGGPGRYCKKDRRSQWVPRLFEGYALNGQLKMREVVNYSQWDLSEKGSYLLDCYDKLYVWYGTQCSETMKQSSILVANTYIRLAATVREMYVGLELFMSGAEPLEFQWVFHTWSPKAVSSIEKVLACSLFTLFYLFVSTRCRSAAPCGCTGCSCSSIAAPRWRSASSAARALPRSSSPRTASLRRQMPRRARPTPKSRSTTPRSRRPSATTAASRPRRWRAKKRGPRRRRPSSARWRRWRRSASASARSARPASDRRRRPLQRPQLNRRLSPLLKLLLNLLLLLLLRLLQSHLRQSQRLSTQNKSAVFQHDSCGEWLFRF